MRMLHSALGESSLNLKYSYVTPIPDELESADAAPMLCAGVTTYAALRRSGAKSGQWVVIAGAGGGLGHIACQLASRGMALRVIAIDDGSKAQLAKDCGAEHFIDITKHDEKSIAEEVVRVAGGLGASAVIVCTASNHAYAQSIEYLRFGGTVVCVGVPEGEPQPMAKCYPQTLVFKQATVTAGGLSFPSIIGLLDTLHEACDMSWQHLL